MSKLKKFLPASILAIILALSLAVLWLSDHYVVPIIMYHHVRYTQKAENNSVSPEIFEWQMRYLSKNNFRVLSLDELVQGVKAKKKFSHRSVVITFDDGYDDNYTYAYPILKKYRFPAIIFLPSELINTPGFLTWDQLKEMNQNGIDVGAHTMHHAYLPDLKPDDQLHEIKGSKETIEKKMGLTVKYFAYPSGGFSEPIKDMLKKSGYEGACTTNRGPIRFGKDVYQLKRVRFSESDDKESELWIKLSGYYNLFRVKKKPY